MSSVIIMFNVCVGFHGKIVQFLSDQSPPNQDVLAATKDLIAA